MNEVVNLTNCDREPIHTTGSVQPFGFLLAVLSDFTICMASNNNVGNFLGTDVAELLHQPLSSIVSEAAVETIRSRVDHLGGPDATERLFGVELQPGKPPFDLYDSSRRRLSDHRGGAERARGRHQFGRTRAPDAREDPQDARHC